MSEKTWECGSLLWAGAACVVTGKGLLSSAFLTSADLASVSAFLQDRPRSWVVVLEPWPCALLGLAWSGHRAPSGVLRAHLEGLHCLPGQREQPRSAGVRGLQADSGTRGPLKAQALDGA